jgi:hypothetical protein
MLLFVVTLFVVVAIVVLAIFLVLHTDFAVKVDVLVALIALISSTLSTSPAIVGRDSVHELAVTHCCGLATVNTVFAHDSTLGNLA